MTEPVWLGLDLGTQSVRALAVDRDGTVLGSAVQRLTSRRDGPRHEQDPEQWWSATAAACREALAGLAGHPVGGVAVDATSGTVLLTDAGGRALTPALMYDDTRADADRVNEAGVAVWAKLGYGRMQPSWALPKVLWLLREHADVVPQARLTHQNDFVNRRLVGHEVAADLSNALKTGADLIDENWPSAVLDELGVPSHLLPGLVRSGSTLGTVCAAASAATGIPAGTPVIAGMTDGCAAQLGAGVRRPGDWNSVLGTTLVLKGVTRDLIRDPSAVVYSHKAPNGDWLPGGASSTGAGIIARDYAGRDLAELDRQALDYEPAGVVAYPLAGSGERFPFVAPQARGFCIGIPRDDAEGYAAVLQGVAFLERLCVDYLDQLGAPVDGDYVITGGATRNAYWNQLRADILHRPVSVPENAESALGMAVLAAGGENTAAMVRIRQVIEPRATATGRFDEPYLRFVEELDKRGWLAEGLAAHAHERTTR
ncbi:carbohydrate kinase [Actinoplanes bogorensis]|uniref:Carbohydrate kinase n=1 Tax=Paractinoplanes bogorensis TaxID=1610840 RepID=A0ABS5YZ05_9ACTN|nr:FGGY family carbohydrate kinase [Actinoplanes bogorensis]MBU2667350.1 carbohydrate kinase [Actinoplanes bogorensis]